jgi:hypothetical protein
MDSHFQSANRRLIDRQARTKSPVTTYTTSSRKAHGWMRHPSNAADIDRQTGAFRHVMVKALRFDLPFIRPPQPPKQAGTAGAATHTTRRPQPTEAE